jgi:hypothetical protein
MKKSDARPPDGRGCRLHTLHPDNCHKTIALSDCDSGRYTDQDEYGRQALAIKEAIESQLADRHAWKNKKCRLHMDFAYDGKLHNVESRDGNKAYCEALVSAAKKPLSRHSLISMSMRLLPARGLLSWGVR